MNFTPIVNSFLNTLLFVIMCINAQSCPTLCNTVDCSPPGSSVGEFPGKNTEVGSHSLLQGIFPTQGLNWGVGGGPSFLCDAFPHTVWRFYQIPPHRLYPCRVTWVQLTHCGSWSPALQQRFGSGHTRGGL